MFDFIFDAMFIIVPILVIGIFILIIAMMFSPKLRGKFMSNQIKATRHMIDGSRDDLKDIGTTLNDISIQTKNDTFNQNEEILKDISRREANIAKENIEIKTRAIRDGFSKNTIYCKYCGKLIDEDSRFCKHCGSEQ